MGVPVNTPPFSNSPPGTNVVDADAVNEKFDRLYEYLAAGVEKLAEGVLPPGVISAFVGGMAPSSWLLCDGSAVSRSVYDELFAVIGTTYGAGDGTSTFGLPDLRARVPVGKGEHADVDTLGDADGVAAASRTPKHTLSGAEAGVGDHQHNMIAIDQSGGFATVSAAPGGGPVGQSGVRAAYQQTGGPVHNALWARTDVGGAANGLFVTEVAGGAKAAAAGHDHGFLVVNYIIKV